MFKYKKQQASLPNKDGKRLWFPYVVGERAVVTTRQIAREIAERSGATEGDVIGILHDLGLVVRAHLSAGDRVVLKLKINARARGNGVESEDKVSATQFNHLSVHFTPETTRNRALRSTEVTLIGPSRIKFVLADEGEGKKPTKPASPATPPTPNSGGATPALAVARESPTKKMASSLRKD